MADSEGLSPGEVTPRDLTSRDAAAQLGDLVAELCDARGRADLSASMRAALERLAGSVRVVVTGEFKQGKSTLVNALCGADVCPVDDDVATAVPTIVRYAIEPAANAILASETADGEERRALGFEELPSWIREDGQRVGDAGLTAIEVAVPSTLLRAGLSLVDMPGAGGMATPQSTMTLSAILPTCDAAIVVSDAGQPLTATEAEQIDVVHARVRDVLLVKTKIDIHPFWARVVASDDSLVRGDGVSTVGAAPALAIRARRVNDRELAIESSVPEVSRWLQHVAASARDRLALEIAETSVDACTHLAAPLEQESASLRDPAGRAKRTAQLEVATEEATRLRGAASRWQQVMGDAMGDVTNDLADDLRSRFRALLSTAEESVDQLDPATAWVEFEPEFRRRVTEAASAHQLAVHDRLLGCARRVEAVFSEEEAAVDELIPAANDQTSNRGGTPVAVKELKKAGVGAKTMGAVRASYSGAVLTGFVTGVLGLTLAAPVALAAGVAVGYRGIREDSKRQLAQRQALAKTAMRQYVDELASALSKQTRDTVRRTQRTLRDHFTQRADELLRSAAASLDAAKNAAALAEHQATERLADVATELGHINAVRDLATKTRDGIAVALAGATA